MAEDARFAEDTDEFDESGAVIRCYEAAARVWNHGIPVAAGEEGDVFVAHRVVGS